MTEPKELLLTETGVEWLPDGGAALNVGPIVRALKFLTEGMGDDRGMDEAGNPLPDLMSLAFDVISAIILGGRRADYFRQVKRDLEAQDEAAGKSSLRIAKEAKRIQGAARPTALEDAADTLQGFLLQLNSAPLDEASARDAAHALEAFRDFGAERWVTAAAQLLLALRSLRGALPAAEELTTSPARKRKRAKPPSPVVSARRKAKAVAKRPTAKHKAAPKSAKVVRKSKPKKKRKA